MPETKIILRHITASDKNELVSLMVRSQEFHSPWIQSPNSGPMFEAYLKRIKRSDHEGFAVCRASDSSLVGVINVNNIVRGSLLTASLGYYVGHSFQGEGYMSAGLKSLVQHAFTTMGLHRLEANIQPGNVKSINMVKRCGFSFEGLSKKFLFIEGQWRDHERWSIVDSRSDLRA